MSQKQKFRKSPAGMRAVAALGKIENHNRFMRL
jgi:hypothetical protein